MDTIAVAYSVNTPEYPDLPNSTIRFFRDELLTEYEIIGIELPVFYGSGDGQPVDLDDVSNRLTDCVGIFAQPAALDQRVIEAAPRLAVIAAMGSGYERIDVPTATERGIVVTHNPEVPAPYVAEYTVMALISLLREIADKQRKLREGIWEAARVGAPALSDATVGLIGLGNIGYRVAQLLQPFGTTVLGYDPYVDGTSDSLIYPRYDRATIEDAGVELTTFEDVLDRSVAVSLHVPSNDETFQLIGDEELDRLGDGYLINTSRGPVVDETAVIEHLQSGQLRGAALDVFTSEPPEPTSPLLAAESVIATPHISGIVEGLFEKQARAGAEKIKKILEGEPVDTIVNPEVLTAPDRRT